MHPIGPNAERWHRWNSSNGMGTWSMEANCARADAVAAVAARTACTSPGPWKGPDGADNPSWFCSILRHRNRWLWCPLRHFRPTDGGSLPGSNPPSSRSLWNRPPDRRWIFPAGVKCWNSTYSAFRMPLKPFCSTPDQPMSSSSVSTNSVNSGMLGSPTRRVTRVHMFTFINLIRTMNWIGGTTLNLPKMRMRW